MAMTSENFTRFLVFAAGFALAGGGSAAPAGETVSKLTPFLENHCFECHDDETSKGDLDLTSLPFEPSKPGNFSDWERVFSMVQEGDMPPKKKERPAEADRSEFLDLLKAPLLEVVMEDVRANGRVRGRRLTRVEYEHTMHDLLGIDVPLVEDLPADETGSEFETVADLQQLSHFHLDNYLSAADKALDEAFGRLLRGDKVYKKSFGVKELTSNPGGGNFRGPEGRGGKVICWPVGLQFAGRLPATRVPESGWYRITIKNLRGLNPGPDGAVWGTLRTGGGSSNEPVLYYVASVEATAKRETHQYEAWIREDHLIEFRPNEGTNKVAPSGASGGNVSFAGRNLEKQGFSGLEFDGIELERIYPNATQVELRRKLVPGIKFEKGKPVAGTPEKEVRNLVMSFAAKAFRRPVSEEQVAPYVELALASFKESKNLGAALKAGYRAILCSPRFLSFVEAPGPLDDHSVASRLSYMLWDSMPDEKLRELADRGELRQPEALAGEIERLLSDPKSERFVASFTDQWLNLKQIDFTSPDQKLFREFDPILQDSMVQETRAFVAELVRGNLSVSHFIRSDFAMLNSRLKTHYAFEKAKLDPGEGLQKVSLPSGYQSGLVTQGSILKVTADGTTTSPVLRGVWVSERILGLEVPPPPPNVPAVEPDIRGATSIRDQLAKHSSDTSCAACHAKFDPAGFALESFDPVGKWRTNYGGGKGTAKVDPSGITPDGVEFSGVSEWKEIYHGRPELLAQAFAEHLLTYGTGAGIGFSDRDGIEKIVARAKGKDYGVRSIIHAALQSEIFLNK